MAGAQSGGIFSYLIGDKNPSTVVAGSSACANTLTIDEKNNVLYWSRSAFKDKCKSIQPSIARCQLSNCAGTREVVMNVTEEIGPIYYDAKHLQVSDIHCSVHPRQLHACRY